MSSGGSAEDRAYRRQGISVSKAKLSGIFSYMVFLFPILALGLFLRMIDLGRTALEVDEAANHEVAMSIYNTGTPSFKPELGQVAQPYLFHPPFGFDILAGWAKLTSTSFDSARLLNVFASMIVLLLVFAILCRYGKGVALLGTLFVALDCWIVLTNRMIYLENMLLIPILIGVWFLIKAGESGKTRTYVLAGLAFGIAIIFKHIGIYLVLSIVATWLLVRKDNRGYFWMLMALTFVVLAYVIGMRANFGQIFFDQEFTEFDRLIGTSAARGINFGPIDALRIIADKYWIFVTTVITLVFGWILVTVRYLRSFHKRDIASGHAVLLSWAVAGFVFAVVSKLKSPNYLILWLVPLYMYLAVVIIHWASGQKKILVPALAVAFVFVNMLSWNYRIIQTSGDALRDSAAYINNDVPSDAVVATESSIAPLIIQQYVRLDTMTSDKLNKVDYIAYYTSSTVRVTDLPPIAQEAIQNCQTVQEFSGFKDKVTLCKTTE
jgi:4-amino-4-deoxy-L-arabinose transferase-like glycosyltransferase